MLPVLQIGPLALQTPGLILLAGLWLGLSLAERWASRFETDPNTLYNLVFTLLAAGVVGARLAYALRHADIFLKAPLNLFSLNLGLLDPWGGVAVSLIAGLIYADRKNLAPWPTLDALTPVLAVFAVAVGLANLASGDAFGLETDLPWGIELWGTRRHPTQIYETLAALLILGILWPRRGKTGPVSGVPGGTFLFFLASSAAARLFFEAFRGDSHLLAGNLKTAQLAAWGVLAISLWALRQRR